MKSLGDTWTNYRGPTEQWSQGSQEVKTKRMKNKIREITFLVI